mgnify:CR=1 FL=1
MLLLRSLPAAVAVSFALVAPATAAPDDDKPPAYQPREHYTKYEYRIPMRDGKRLFTAVYVPKDASRRYPFLMVRTPYSCGPYGVDRLEGLRQLAPSEDFLTAGYIFVCQDVRGRYQSEGQWRVMTPHLAAKRGPADVDESTDTHDSVQWLITHVAGNNGRVGLWGISYPGYFAGVGGIDSHPAVKAISPQAPCANWFFGDDVHHNGGFMLQDLVDFMAFFGPKR